MKWITKPTIYVNLETGEVFDNRMYFYRIIEQERHSKTKGDIMTIQWTMICKVYEKKKTVEPTLF